MNVKTTRFGDIEVNEKDIILLPAGIIGFPELKKYILLDHDKDSPFKWLQSLEDGAIAFVLINPLLFKPDYAVEVSESEISDLELENEEDAVVSVIITMPNNPKNMTANLKAPLIFNLKNRKGKQIILSSSEYTTRHNIIEEVKKYTQNKEDETVQEVIDQAKQDHDEEKPDQATVNSR
ncbi:MAG: flagellar assembly protein FliW [Oligoflexales bacterium]|nr:flagellar assembly protein FliW [Oligoflexales bacterium]